MTLGLEEKSLGDDEVVSLRRAACLPERWTADVEGRSGWLLADDDVSEKTGSGVGGSGSSQTAWGWKLVVGGGDCGAGPVQGLSGANQ